MAARDRDGESSRADGEATAPDDGAAGPAADDSQRAPLSARNVVKEYESGDRTLRALKGVDVDIEPGEFVAIVGPSGSGKSTLLNTLGLLDTPTNGTVALDGTDVETLSKRERTAVRRETIGFVFQSFYLVPTLTALENVMVPRLLAGSLPETRDRARELLEQVGLGGRTGHAPDELSGGQKQRVAVARSLINDPDVVLADEPTGNLDRDTGDRVLSVFDDIVTDGVSVVTVTHDRQVTEYADRVIALTDGEIDDGGVESTHLAAP